MACMSVNCLHYRFYFFVFALTAALQHRKTAAHKHHLASSPLASNLILSLLLLTPYCLLPTPFPLSLNLSLDLRGAKAPRFLLQFK